jgi:hypothetical protein
LSSGQPNQEENKQRNPKTTKETEKIEKEEFKRRKSELETEAIEVRLAILKGDNYTLQQQYEVIMDNPNEPIGKHVKKSEL